MRIINNQRFKIKFISKFYFGKVIGKYTKIYILKSEKPEKNKYIIKQKYLRSTETD